MPTSKSSTLSREELELRSTLLSNLLSFIHRDSGQYTLLAGYQTSVDEAMKVIGSDRNELSALRRARNRALRRHE